jgi:multidrug transporter EmrE-like cation transporter
VNTPEHYTSTAQQRKTATLLVFVCTIFGAAAQILLKIGSGSLTPNPSLQEMIVQIFTHLPLFMGYAFYGVSTILLVLALRHGQLSLLYPVIALTFVWVTVLSVIIFHDSINPVKMAGIAVIVGGVAILGAGAHK